MGVAAAFLAYGLVGGTSAAPNAQAAVYIGMWVTLWAMGWLMVITGFAIVGLSIIHREDRIEVYEDEDPVDEDESDEEGASTLGNGN